MKREICPDEAEWRELIAGAIGDSEQVEWLEDHLSQCEACQGRLDGLSARRSETVAAVVDGESPAAGRPGELCEALEAVMETARAGDFPMRSEAGAGEPAPVDLSFLEDGGSGDGSLGRLGKYEVSSVIAEGGMGLVLRAHDPDLHREVAIKVLSPRLAVRKRSREMFLREARAAAGVEHENVLPIYLVERSGELPWFVMPLVRGGTVEGRLGSTSAAGIEFDEVLELALKTARGLAAAHARGLVHRDIKPANIMLDPDGGNVWLADFGLAAAAEAGEGSGRIAGTPGFMAPEVVAGDTADERSDLFSLGCVLFAMATGKDAFSGDTVEQLLEAVKNEEPAPISGKRIALIPPWFGELIGRLLAKSPDDRLQSAAELVTILESQIEERRRAAWRARVWSRVRRGLAIAGAALLSMALFLWLLGVTGRTRGINRALAAVSGDAFSVKGRIGVHESLGDAVKAAPGRGGVIEIFGGETWKTSPVRIEGKAVAIRAVGNGVPVLRAVSEVAPLIGSDSDLEIEGVVLEQRGRPRKGVPALISTVGGELRLRRCRLLCPNRPSNTGTGIVVGVEDSTRVDFEDVEIQGRYAFGFGFRNRKIAERCTIRLSNVVYLGPLLLMLIDERTPQEVADLVGLEARVDIERCTVMSGTLLHLASRGAAYPMTIRFERNAFDCAVGLLTSLGKSESTPRGLIRWIEGENWYAVPTDMYLGQGRGTLGNPMPQIRATSEGWDDLADWIGLERGGSRRVDRIFTEEVRDRFEKKGTIELGEDDFTGEFRRAGAGRAGADLGWFDRSE